MNEVKILISNTPRVVISTNEQSIGSVGDNFAVKFTFNRPNGLYEDANLRVIFGTEYVNFQPIDLGKGDELIIQSSLTQADKLRMEIAFTNFTGESDDAYAQSNVLEFHLRHSIRPGNVPITQFPYQTNSGGIADAPYDGKLYGRIDGMWQEIIAVLEHGDFSER